MGFLTGKLVSISMTECRGYLASILPPPGKKRRMRCIGESESTVTLRDEETGGEETHALAGIARMNIIVETDSWRRAMDYDK